MKWLGLVGGALAGAVLVGCGGSEFSSAGDTGGAGAGGSSAGGSSAGGSSAGGSSTGGSAAGGSAGSSAGGSAGSAGSFPGGSGGGPSGGTGGTSPGGAGAGGAAGTGGTGPCKTACGMAEYCDEDTGKCTSCSTIGGRLRFGTPTRVPLNNSSGVDDRFPRVADDGTLWYTRGDGDGGYSVVKLSPPYSGAPSVQYQNSSGYIPRGIDGEGLKFSAAFDTKEMNGTRKLRGVDSDAGTSELAGLNQVAGANVTTLDYSIAVGSDRVWWMSDRVVAGQAGGPHLHTAQPGFALKLDFVPLVLEDGCHAASRDLTPWAGKAGALLLFSAQPLGAAGCLTSVDGDAKELYWTLMDNSGQQVGQAKRIEISDSQLDDTEPSLSPDLCTIIYSRSENGGSENHDLYTATRR